MNLQSLINSRFSVGLALALGRIIPISAGYKLADFLADRIANRWNSSLVRAIRSNQWVVHGGNLSEEDTRRVVKDTLRNVARCQFELYHNLRNPNGIRQLVDFGDRGKNIIQKSRAGQDGLLVIGLHMNNFDMMMQAAIMQGLKDILAIAVPEPGAGYQLQNDIRRDFGLNIIPASISAIREGIAHLRRGGTVITGLDRPVYDQKYSPRFFGVESAIPVYFVPLAINAAVPIYVVGITRQDGGNYRVIGSDPIYLDRYPDRRDELVLNTEKLLKIAEDFIRPRPTEWSMFYPVWPSIIDQLG